MEEHLRCLSAENLNTLLPHAALRCPVAELYCADGQMEQPQEQGFHRDILVHSYCHELRGVVFAFRKQFLPTP